MLKTHFLQQKIKKKNDLDYRIIDDYHGDIRIYRGDGLGNR